MKTTVIILAIIAAYPGGGANAQTADDGVDGLSIGIEAQGNLPLGDFSEASDFGAGGTISVAGGVAPQFSVTGRSGYLYFAGKETRKLFIDLGTVTTSVNLTMVPLLAGMKYFFSPGNMRLYAGAEAGVIIVSGTVERTTPDAVTESSAIDSKTDAAVAPSLGIQFKGGEHLRVDARASFTNLFTGDSSLSWLTIGIGFEWGLN